MAEFLVYGVTSVPEGVEAKRLEELRAGERRRAMELREKGHLKRLWRQPGKWGTVGLYEAADATELHELLSSLPMWPYTEMRVEPLAQHPQER
jgi:muconolactone D-isomerase